MHNKEVPFEQLVEELQPVRDMEQESVVSGDVKHAERAAGKVKLGRTESGGDGNGGGGAWRSLT